MSAIDIVEKTKELPVWSVHGMNWHVDVPMDEYNASFDNETQAYEAASIALMVFRGSEHAQKDIFIVMSEGESIPYLGTTMIVHLKGTEPVKGFFPFTHVILANQGFYNESRKMEALLNADLEAIKQDQIKNEDAQRKIDEQIKSLKKNPPKRE